MKKKTLQLLAVLALSLTLAACNEEPAGKNNEVSEAVGTENASETETENATEQTASEMEEPETREGMYRSELTNEWIDEALKEQRPIAVMVDNEKTALPHYGLTQADVVYEMMNSTKNGKITRFMALVKDWETLEQFGSIRSARPTNFLLAAEWNAILVHDGGPFYIDEYAAQDYSNNLSGGFSRVDNGKPYEFTEYICTGDLDKRIKAYNYSTEYRDSFGDAHYHFASESTPVDLSQNADSSTAEVIELPFPHNSSTLTYDAETQLYYYSEYGQAHLDPQNDNAQLCFKNVLIQCCGYSVYDDNGYMIFHVYGERQPGYYITNGNVIEITWTKSTATDTTRYYDMDGNEITINTGKTYVGIVPDEDWEELVIK